MSEMNGTQGKFFSMTDPNEVKTVIYKVNRTDKEYWNEAPKYTVERLDFVEEMIGEKSKKTFFVDDPAPEGNSLVILSFAKSRVIVNVGYLDYDAIKISKKPVAIKFKTLYSEEETEIREFAYTPNMKRPISIIDPVTTEEIKPILYLDEKTNSVKGKCKLKPKKEYFAFEINQNFKEDF